MRLDRQEISSVAALIDSARSYLETPDTAATFLKKKSHIRLALRECFLLVEEERVEEFLLLWNKTSRNLERYKEEANYLRARHQAVKAWYFAKSQMDSSIIYCDSAEQILNNMLQIDLDLLVRIYQTRAIAYYAGASPLESIRATDTALELAARANPAQTDSVLWGTLFNLRSALHFGFQEFEETIIWLEKFRQTQPKSPSFEARYLGNLAAVYYVQHQFDRAIDLNRQAINIRKRETDKGNRARLAEIYGNQGQFFLTIDEVDSAAYYMGLALTIREENIERRDISIASTQHSLGNIYMQQGEMSKADSLLSAATELYKQALPPYSRVLGDYYDVYSTFLKRIGKLPEALKQRQNGLRVALKKPEKLTGLNNPELIEILLPSQALSNLISKADLQYSLYQDGEKKQLNTAIETAELALMLSRQIRNDIHSKRFHWAMGQYLEPLHQLLVKAYIERYEQNGSQADLSAAYKIVQVGKSEMLRRMRREADAFKRISIPDSLRSHISNLQRRLWRIESMLNLLEPDPADRQFSSLQDSMTYLSSRHAKALQDLSTKSRRFRILYADSTELQPDSIRASLRNENQNLIDFYVV
ncbi:MAG: tetratricopeptide repeat protein, partial [Calditrichota bacterium]